jgi:hypothetical protein
MRFSEPKLLLNKIKKVINGKKKKECRSFDLTFFCI